jgi:cobalt/nickel transport system ATP-binding protein
MTMREAGGTPSRGAEDGLAAALEMREVRAWHAPDSPLALDGCTLTVHAGERVALVGANGSGKTTILLAAAGLVPHAGEILVGGVRLDGRTAAGIRGGIGFLFANPEDQILFPRVLDDVGFALRAQGADSSQVERQATAALASVGASPLADHSPYRLSHGQRLRVALAGALVARAPLLLLDEPTGGLDSEGRGSLLEALQSQGSAMLIATHDHAFARRLCSRFLRVQGGRIVGEVDDLPARDEI